MEIQNYSFCKNQLNKKYQRTVKNINIDNIKEQKNEIEKNEKYKFFSEQICDIMPSSDSILEAYKESDYLNKLKNSNKIIIEMKKYLAHLEPEELSSLNNNFNNFNFNDKLQNIIISEAENNRNLFLDNYKGSKKSYALKIISEIKNKFEYYFPNQDFDIIEFEKKTNEKILGFNFLENEIAEINNLVEIFMIKKFKELINNELNYLSNN